MTIESLDNISTYSIIIIAIYIAVAATIVPFTVMGENIRKTIQENPYFQHILTFSIIFFLIVLFNKIPSNVPLNGLYSIINSPNSELLKLFGISILIYALFIMSSRASLMFDDTICFAHSIAGINADENEIITSIQSVALIADHYVDEIMTMAGGERCSEVSGI